jgi:putative ABC transport system permease protein
MLSDLRHALRTLVKAPGFSLIAILTLSIGIGLNTSMFSLMNLLVLRPLPFPDGDHVARINRTTPQSQTADHAAADYLELARDAKSFADIAAYRMWSTTMAQAGRPPVNLNSLRVSANFFPALGLKPELGRWFTPDEDQPGSHVIMLSHATWQAQFGGDPDIVGKPVRIDGASSTIIGVMPESFSSVFLWGPGDAFRPLALEEWEKANRNEMSLRLLARLNHDITIEQANVRLTALAEQLARTRPVSRSQDGLHAVTLQSTATTPGTLGISWMMLGLAGSVLLIVCANLANLQLARAIARSHEFAIRAALGASRTRLLRPLLCESMLLSLLGGALGVLIAMWANDWISSRLSANGFVVFKLTLDWIVLAFALVASIATGLIFGVVPAWLMSRIRVSATLKSGTRGNTGDRAQHRLRHSLIVGQFALALVLLAGAGIFIRGLNQILKLDAGWEQHGVLQGVVNLPQAKYPDPARTYAFYTQVQERLAALPGVENVSVAWTLPIFQFFMSRNYVVEGRAAPPPGREPLASLNAVTPSFLPTLKTKLLSGRNFTEADTATAPAVAIINETMAKTLFPNENPIGHRIGGVDPTNRAWMEIVGVMPDLRFAVNTGIPQNPFQIFRPLAQETWNYVTIVIRGNAVETLAEPMRKTIAEMDPDLAVQQLNTVPQLIKQGMSSFMMINTILVCFAGLGLFLAALGLYGVIANLVVQRTPEIGVRVALGAQSQDVVWLVMRSGLRLTLIGTVIGLLGAYGLTRIINSFMPAVGVSHLAILSLVTVVLLVVALVACWLPSRRAAHIDPMVALRAD